jgi:hypothetical protein
MFSFIAFLTATLAWILSMYALFTVSAAALVISVILYLKDKFLHPKRHTKGKSA